MYIFKQTFGALNFRLFILIFLFLGLLLPNVLESFLINDQTEGSLSKLELLAIAAAVEIFFWSVISSLRILLVIQLPFLLWLPVEVIYEWRYGAPTSPHILHIIAETNVEELIGYLGSYSVTVLYLIYIMIVVFGILFNSLDIRWEHRSRCWVFVSFCGLFLINGLVAELINQRMNHAQESFSKIDDFVEPQLGYGLDDYKNTYPLGFVLRLIEFKQEEKILTETASQLRGMHSSLNKRAIAGQEIYVLVIGESSRADHWSLNGYLRETTPLLSKRSDIFNFSNVVAVSATTRTAVPILLSRTTPADVFQSNLKSSWISDFRQAGFKVYWLSTQLPVGTHDTMIGVYASLSDRVKYLNGGRYSFHTDYDQVLVNEFKNVLAESTEKKLIVLHTLGSHAPYQFRYPTTFEFFQPTPLQNSIVDIFDKNAVISIRNAYDNSVRYTDYVVNELIEELKEKKSVASLLYVSDHGETFIDEGCNLAGHGFGSRFNFHVPMIFWASDNYIKMRTTIIEGVNSNLNKPIYTKDFYDSFLQMAGFEKSGISPNNFPPNSFFNRNYLAGPRWVATNGSSALNYDDEYLHDACGKRK